MIKVYPSDDPTIAFEVECHDSDGLLFVDYYPIWSKVKNLPLYKWDENLSNFTIQDLNELKRVLALPQFEEYEYCALIVRWNRRMEKLEMRYKKRVPV